MSITKDLMILHIVHLSSYTAYVVANNIIAIKQLHVFSTTWTSIKLFVPNSEINKSIAPEFKTKTFCLGFFVCLFILLGFFVFMSVGWDVKWCPVSRITPSPLGTEQTVSLVIWLKYCRYGVKPYPINHLINHFVFVLDMLCIYVYD